MQAWTDIYREVMRDFYGDKVMPHTLLLGGFALLGIFLGMYVYNSFNLLIALWGMGMALDYVLFGDDLMRLLVRGKPYMLLGAIEQRVRKEIADPNTGATREIFYFELDITEAYPLSKSGLGEADYDEKEGRRRLEVPQSMFLSLNTGDEVGLVCMPNDQVWGWVREETEEEAEVIRITE